MPPAKARAKLVAVAVDERVGELDRVREGVMDGVAVRVLVRVCEEEPVPVRV